MLCNWTWPCVCAWLITGRDLALRRSSGRRRQKSLSHTKYTRYLQQEDTRENGSIISKSSCLIGPTVGCTAATFISMYFWHLTFYHLTFLMSWGGSGGGAGPGVEDGSGSDEETNKKRNLTSLKVTLTLTCSTPREFIRWRSAAVIKPFCQSDCQWNFSFFFFFILKLKAAPPSPPWPSPLYSKAAPQRLFTPVHG